MRKDHNTWDMDKRGSIVFYTEEEILNTKFSPDNAFDRPAIAYGVMFGCAAVDAAFFYQLLSKMLYDTPVLIFLSVMGLLFGFDFAPCYLGILMKKHDEGYRINKYVAIMLATSFLVAFVINIVLRIGAKDVVLPDLSNATSLIGTVDAESSSNPLALIFAICSSFIPVATSLCSFGVSFMTYHPLENDLKKLEQKALLIENDLIQTRSVLQEMKAIPDYFERMMAEDDRRFSEACKMTVEKAIRYADWVREQIKEFIADNPAGINELSKAQYDQILKLLSYDGAAKVMELLAGEEEFMFEVQDVSGGGVPERDQKELSAEPGKTDYIIYREDAI